MMLRNEDEKAVRTLQLFLMNAPWNDQQMKRIYQNRVVQIASDVAVMLTVDGSDFANKGTYLEGAHRQYCGRGGKVDNCQAGVFVGNAGASGYGLLNARFDLPQVWFDEAHQALWSSCDIPETTTFQTMICPLS